MHPWRSMPTTEQPSRDLSRSSPSILPWQSAKSGSVQSIITRFQSRCGSSHRRLAVVSLWSSGAKALRISTSISLCQ